MKSTSAIAAMPTQTILSLSLSPLFLPSTLPYNLLFTSVSRYFPLLIDCSSSTDLSTRIHSFAGAYIYLLPPVRPLGPYSFSILY